MLDNKKQRLIITGSNGFIGTHLIERLLGIDGHELILLNRTPSPFKELEQYHGSFSDKVLLGDIIQPDDIVMHLACSSIPSISENGMADDIRENLIGTLNLLDVCQQKKIKKFIFFSSGGTVYGQIKNPAKESDCLRPVNAHGAMKASIENYIGICAARNDFVCTILRLSNPYGRQFIRSKAQGFIDIAMNMIINGEEFEVWGDGSVVRDYIHIDDLIEAIILILMNEKPAHIVYNIGSGRGTSINEVIEIIKDVYKKDFKIAFKEARGFDMDYNTLDICRIKNDFNWEPKKSIRRGIEEIIERYEKN